MSPHCHAFINKALCISVTKYLIPEGETTSMDISKNLKTENDYFVHLIKEPSVIWCLCLYFAAKLFVKSQRPVTSRNLYHQIDIGDQGNKVRKNKNDLIWWHIGLPPSPPKVSRIIWMAPKGYHGWVKSKHFGRII